MADLTINQLAAISGLADGDELAAWDVSLGGTNKTRKVTLAQLRAFATAIDINGLGAAAGGPASTDEIAIYDVSAPGNRKVTLSQILSLVAAFDIDGLTGASPATGDYVPIFDVSVPGNRKATISDILALGGAGAGKLALSLTPYGAEYPSSNFPQLLLINRRPALAHDAATDETAQWTFYVPAALAGALTAKLYFIMASATTGDVVWTVAVEAVTPADAFDLDAGDSFATANSVTQAVHATAGYLAVANVPLTNNDSIAGSDYVRLRVSRDADHASDTAAGDAYLLLVGLQEA